MQFSVVQFIRSENDKNEIIEYLFIYLLQLSYTRFVWKKVENSLDVIEKWLRRRVKLFCVSIQSFLFDDHTVLYKKKEQNNLRNMKQMKIQVHCGGYRNSTQYYDWKSIDLDSNCYYDP